MERVTDREFCTSSQVTFSSTGIDRHGDRMALSTLYDMKKQIESNPEIRQLTLNHQTEEKVGEIVDVWVEEDEDQEIHFLRAEIGIFEDRSDVIDMIESGDLGGFSISMRRYENCDAEFWENQTPAIKVVVDGHERSSLNQILQVSGAPYRIEIQKALDAAAIFDFLSTNWDSFVQLVSLIVLWRLNQSDGGYEVSPTISLVHNEVNIDVDALSQKVIERTGSEELSEEGLENFREAVEAELKDIRDDL